MFCCIRFGIAIVALVAACSCSAWAQIIINVSPYGSSKATWPDLEKHPNASVSLERAIAISESSFLRNKAGLPKDTIRIQLEPGVYRLTEPLVLDAAISGSDVHPVIISGPKDASAVISGGRTITNYVPVRDPKILARLPKKARSHVVQSNLLALGITDFGRYTYQLGATHIPWGLQLYFDGQFMPMARWPDSGYARISRVPNGKMGRVFSATAAHISDWKDKPLLLASGYWFYNWAYETFPIERIDPEKGEIILSKPGPSYGLKAGQPFFIQNVLSELNVPGDWYLDTINGILYFWPPKPIKGNSAEVSLLNNILRIKKASYLQITGLTFQSCRSDALSIQDGDHVIIKHSVIRDVAGNGVIISGHNNGLDDVTIEDIGEGGVILSGGDRTTLAPANLFVKGSNIHKFGQLAKTYCPGIMIAGVGNQVIGNHIYDAPHSAIIFSGNDHLISGNEINDVCMETGDAGAIYTGRDWSARGTKITYNYIHDIPFNISRGNTMGIYLDDQASGITIRNNLFARMNYAVFIGGGRDNLVENNTFIDCLNPVHIDDRGLTWQKAMSVDPNGVFQTRLKAVPYNKPPYSLRYPHLADILHDDLGAPKYNSVRNNKIVHENDTNEEKSIVNKMKADNQRFMR